MKLEFHKGTTYSLIRIVYPVPEDSLYDELTFEHAIYEPALTKLRKIVYAM